MLPKERFVFYADCADHDFDLSTLGMVNEVTGLGFKFSYPDYRDFPDNEPGFRISDEDIERIRDNHVVFFSCPIDYELDSQLENMTGCLKYQYGAKSVTVVLRFLRYRRQENEKKPYEFNALQQFFRKLKYACGVDRVIVVEPHNIANTQKYCDEVGLELCICNPTRLFAKSVQGLVDTRGAENVYVYAPDIGAVRRNILLAKALGTRVFARPKERLNGHTIVLDEEFDEEQFLAEIARIYGEEVEIFCDLDRVKGKDLVMVDDEAATGKTSSESALLLRKAGAQSVHLVVTHPVCTSGWKDVIIPRNGPKPFNSIFFGNARPRGDGLRKFKQRTMGKIITVDLGPVLAESLIEVLEGITD